MEVNESKLIVKLMWSSAALRATSTTSNPESSITLTSITILYMNMPWKNFTWASAVGIGMLWTYTANSTSKIQMNIHKVTWVSWAPSVQSRMQRIAATWSNCRSTTIEIATSNWKHIYKEINHTRLVNAIYRVIVVSPCRISLQAHSHPSPCKLQWFSLQGRRC